MMPFIPKSIVLLIFQYIPQTVWCINKYEAHKIQIAKKKWEQWSTRFQTIIFLRRHEEFPDHAYIFKEATQILIEALSLCTNPVYCHALHACHILERAIFLNTFYIQSNFFVPSKIDICKYTCLKQELNMYLVKNKKITWDERAMDRLNNMYPPWRTLPKYEEISTYRKMKWNTIHNELKEVTIMQM